MQISENIEIIDLTLWIKDKQVLVLSDFHIGYEESMLQRGILVPKQQMETIQKRLNSILSKIKPKTIIINGDLKHNFGSNLRQEWNDTFKLIDFFKQKCEELIFIKGNHDNFLKTIAAKKDIKVVEQYQVNDILIIHGDKLIETEAKRIIIGHEHPAISLREKSKMEKFKCFLKGKWKSKELIVMPSFNPLSYGTDIHQPGHSPFLKDKSNFEVFVVNEGEVFNFGKVKNFSEREI